MAFSQSDAANVAMVIKQAQPGISDADLASLVQQAGEVNDDPVKTAELFKSISGKVVPAVQAQDVQTPVPAIPAVQTQLPSSYAGAGYTQADLMKAFNPAQLQAAAAQQQAAYNASLPQRTIGGILAGGSGSESVMGQNRSAWEGIDKQNMLQSLDKQKLLQEQATQGLAAGTSAQNMAKTAGEYTLSQGKGQQELAQAQQKTTTGALGVQAQQRLNSPTSPETILAKSILANQLNTDPSLKGNVELTALLKRGDVTAQQLMAFMSPDVLNAYKTKVGIAKETAETIKQEQQNTLAAGSEGLPKPTSALPTGAQPAPAVAPAPVSATSAAPAVAPMPVPISGGPNKTPAFNFAPGTDLRAIREIMKTQPANVLAAFDAQYPGVATATGPFPAPANVNATAISRMQRQGGTPTATQAGALPVSSITPQSMGAPIASALAAGKPQPDNHEPAYLAEANDSVLTDVQKLEKQALTETEPSKVIALNRKIADLQGVPYKAPTPLQYTGSGMERSGLTSANTGATAQDIQSTQAQVAQYNQGGQEAAKFAAANAAKAGWSGPNVITAGNPGAQQLKLSIDKLNADALALGLISSGKDTGAAGVVGAGGAAVSALPGGISKIAGPLIGATAGLVGNTQPITITSDPAVIQEFAYKVQLAAARKQALIAQQQAYADRNNGDGTGFITSPMYKHIMSAKPFVDPATGVLELPLVANKRQDLLKSGYVPLDRLLSLGK